MNKRLILMTIVGIIASLLGLLWYLQGSEIIHLDPILCVSNCQPLTEKSVLWQFIGVATFLAGVFAVAVSVRKATHQQKDK